MHAELRWAQDLALNVDADARETPGRLDDVGRLSHEVLSLMFRGMKGLTRCGHGSFGFDRRVFFLSINTFVRDTCNTHRRLAQHSPLWAFLPNSGVASTRHQLGKPPFQAPVEVDVPLNLLATRPRLQPSSDPGRQEQQLGQMTERDAFVTVYWSTLLYFFYIYNMYTYIYIYTQYFQVASKLCFYRKTVFNPKDGVYP